MSEISASIKKVKELQLCNLQRAYCWTLVKFKNHIY